MSYNNKIFYDRMVNSNCPNFARKKRLESKSGDVFIIIVIATIALTVFSMLF